MKNIKRKYIVATAILIFGAAVAGMGAVYAADSTQKINPMSELVTAIAQKFNLNVADVQSVFDTQQTKMKTEREQALTDRINQVTAGKLTQAQVTAISSKKAEFDALQTSLQGKTAQERATAMQSFETSLKQWATDNNISEEYLPMCGGGKGMFGGRGTVGKVTANDGTTITMSVTEPKSTTATSYTVTAASGATIKKVAKGTGTDAKLVETAIAISDIAVGDTIMANGTISGTTISATQITDGAMGIGMGHGRGSRGFGGMR